MQSEDAWRKDGGKELCECADVLLNTHSGGVIVAEHDPAADTRERKWWNKRQKIIKSWSKNQQVEKKIRTRWNTKHTKTKTNQIKRRELRRRRRWNTRNKQTGGWSGTGDIIRTINKRQRQKRQTWNMWRNLTEQKTWNRIQTSWQTLTNCQEQSET